MSFRAYLRHRRAVLTGLVAGLGLATAVWLLDAQLRGQAGVGYALLLMFTAAAVGVVVDLVTYRRRLGELRRVAQTGAVPTTGMAPDGDPASTVVAELAQAHHRALEEEHIRHAEAVDFFGAWIHEIKTPLSVMRLIAERTSTDELAAEVGRVEQNLERALFFLRGASFAHDYVIAPVAVGELVRERIRHQARVFIAGGVRVSAEGPWFEVETDPKWLAFIVDQLLQNAARYTPAGGTVTVSMHREPDQTRLHVCDTGIGIPVPELPRVFDRAFTGSNGRLHPGSTGMGLYLARLVAERLGHRITVNSAVGEGTSFTITVADTGAHFVGGR